MKSSYVIVKTIDDKIYITQMHVWVYFYIFQELLR